MRIWERQRPTLSFVYLPHLDYDLQRLGPNHPGIAAQVAAVDALCAPLIARMKAIGGQPDYITKNSTWHLGTGGAVGRSGRGMRGSNLGRCARFG